MVAATRTKNGHHIVKENGPVRLLLCVRCTAWPYVVEVYGTGSWQIVGFYARRQAAEDTYTAEFQRMGGLA